MKRSERRSTSLAAAVLSVTAVVAVGVAAEPPDREPWRITAANFRGDRTGEEVVTLVDVEILHDALSVFADRGYWSHTSAVVRLAGGVRLLEASSVVTCDSAVYWRRTENARLYGDVRASDGPFEARGDSGHVERLDERVSIFGHARVDDESGRIEAERIDYDRRSGVAVARGKVRADDRESANRITGERLVYNATTDMAIVTGAPRLTSGGDGESPMEVDAEEMRLERATGFAEALRNVRIRQGAVEARAGRARFDRAGGSARLLERPAVWDSTARVTADTLDVEFANDEIHRLVALGRVLVEQAHVSGSRAGERLVASGDRATAWFSLGQIDSLRIDGHAVSDYVPPGAERSAGSGVNHARADRIHVYLENGRAVRIRLVGGAIGRYWFPPNEGRASGSAPASADTLEAPEGAGGTAPADTSVAPSAVLTLGIVSARADTSAAEPDAAVSDSLVWVGRVRSLDEVAPPDSLFPGGMEHVTYAGASVEFDVETAGIELREEASVQYEQAWLRAGRVVFDTHSQVLEATQGPTLEEAGSELKGRKMRYDVEAREGVVDAGLTEFDGGYYYGRRIKKLEDETILGQSCTYTTCDRASPHYHFGIHAMKIRLRDKVVGRPVVLHIANIPVLAVPYFLFPIQRGRRSGIFRPEIEFGFSTSRGRFVRNLGYYWAISDYADAAGWVDYAERSPKGWVGHVETRYNKRYVLDGSVTASGAINLPERTSSPDVPTSRSRRWELRARHRQNLPWEARLTLDADFVSSKAFRLEQSFGDDFTENVDRLLTSNLALSRSWSGASANVRVRRQQDLEAESGDPEVTWALPSFTFSLNRRTFGRRAQGRDSGFLPVLASLGYSYSLRTEQPVVELKDGGTTREFALRHDVNVTDTRSLGPFAIAPRLSYSELLFEEDALGRRWRRAGRWNGGASLNTTLYGTLIPTFGPLVAFRHVMQPSIGFTYTPAVSGASFVDPEGVTRPVYPNVGGISFGNSSRSRRLTFRLTHDFQAKIRDGEKIRTFTDLVDVSMSTSLDLDADQAPWAPLSTSMRIRPVNAFNVDVGTSHGLNGEGLRSFRVISNLNLRGEGGSSVPAGTESLDAAGRDDEIGGAEGLVDVDVPRPGGQFWSLSLSHTYSRGTDASAFTSDLNGTLSVTPTKNWSVSYRASANLREKEVVSQSFAVRRDLHCWQASFERSLNGSSESYYFRIGVRDIPEIKYEQRR